MRPLRPAPTQSAREPPADQDREEGEGDQEQPLAVVDRDLGAEEEEEQEDRPDQEDRRGVEPSVSPAPPSAPDPETEQAHRDGRREIGPGVMPGDVPVEVDPAEVEDPDRDPVDPGAQVAGQPAHRVGPEPGPAGEEGQEADAEPARPAEQAPTPAQPRHRPEQRDGDQEPGMDLGQEGQAEPEPRQGQARDRPAPFDGAGHRQEGEGPEAGDERVERPEVRMREHPGHQRSGRGPPPRPPVAPIAARPPRRRGPPGRRKRAPGASRPATT